MFLPIESFRWDTWQDGNLSPTPLVLRWQRWHKLLCYHSPDYPLHLFHTESASQKWNAHEKTVPLTVARLPIPKGSSPIFFQDRSLTNHRHGGRPLLYIGY